MMRTVRVVIPDMEGETLEELGRTCLVVLEEWIQSLRCEALYGKGWMGAIAVEIDTGKPEGADEARWGHTSWAEVTVTSLPKEEGAR